MAKKRNRWTREDYRAMSDEELAQHMCRSRVANEEIERRIDSRIEASKEQHPCPTQNPQQTT
jgi:hypothetical protein